MPESLDALLIKYQSPIPLQSSQYDFEKSDQLAIFFRKQNIRPKSGETEFGALELRINLAAQDLLNYLSASDQERKQAAKLYVEGRIDFLKEAIKTLAVLIGNRRFCQFVSIQVGTIEGKCENLQQELESIRKSGRSWRTGPLKHLPIFLKPLIYFFNSYGHSRYKQVKILHKMFVEFGIPGFGYSHLNSESKSGATEERDRIHTWLKRCP